MSTTQPTAKNKKHKNSNQNANWAEALLEYCLHPENHPEIVVHQNERLVIAKDKFPKAQVHYLVMPRQKKNGFSQVDQNDLPLIDEMKNLGTDWITSHHPNLKFKMGFHAVPSMKQLHMHIISLDFNSPKLKNKKHWNSFNTKFFIPVDDFQQILKDEKKISFAEMEFENLLKDDVVCCGATFKDINQLKKHLSSDHKF